MIKFQLYAIGLILVLVLLWATVPYVIGVVIMLLVANQVIKLIRKSNGITNNGNNHSV